MASADFDHDDEPRENDPSTVQRWFAQLPIMAKIAFWLAVIVVFVGGALYGANNSEFGMLPNSHATSHSN